MGRVKIKKVYQPLYTTKKRYTIITGGRGSLKSSTVHDFVARLTYQQGHGILFTRYTMTSAEKSIIPEFKLALERAGAINDFTITKTLITNNHTKSFILFSGIKTSSGDQTANLKSLSGITTWVIEEGEDYQDEKGFDDIQRSIRQSGIQNRIIWIQNPSTREHFIYQKFIKDTNKRINVEGFNVTVSNHPNVEHIHTTYRIAEELGYLDKDWINEAEELRQKAEQDHEEFVRSGGEFGRDRHESEYYYKYIGGWLERAEGAIFKNWEEGEFDDKLPFCYGLDYGYSPDPLAVAKVAVDKKKKRIYVHEEVYQTELDDVSGYLEDVGINKKSLIICDTNEERTTRRIKKAGFNIRPVSKNRIVDDIREIKKYTIIVTPESTNIKTEFNNYVWNDKKASIPIDDYNHLCDAIRYAFGKLTSKKRTIEVRN